MDDELILPMDRMWVGRWNSAYFHHCDGRRAVLTGTAILQLHSGAMDYFHKVELHEHDRL